MFCMCAQIYTYTKYAHIYTNIQTYRHKTQKWGYKHKPKYTQKSM